MGIHERARLFGGHATIESEPGKGTKVRVVIPITAIVLPVQEGGFIEGVPAQGPEASDDVEG